MTASPRWPVEPLLADRNVTTLAHAVGVLPKSVWRRVHTGLDTFAADRWATACGLHPIEVWPDWGDAPAPVDRPPHGDRRRYVAGCHCWRCKAANRTYLAAYRRRRTARTGERIVRGNFVPVSQEAAQ